MISRTRKIAAFTLIELVMVIVILGILAAVAIPNFFNLQNRAFDSAEQGIVGGVRAGISTLHANNVSNVPPIVPNYPATLDATPNGTVCNVSGATPCFATVLAQGGITDGAWTRVLPTIYSHVGSNTSCYQYTPGTGQFICVGAPLPAGCVAGSVCP